MTLSKKRIKFGLTLILGILLLTELLARFFGLCDYPLYTTHPTYEYIHAPNQQHVIYRNNFATNSWSMRSNPIDLKKDSTVVLLIGDSVINGGNLTDQDRLASTLLEKWLSQCRKKNVRVLNISAGSWGPDNVAAYLKEQGTFHADLMLLVVNSHDAYDNIEFMDIVGKHPQFPTKQVTFAWEKIIERGQQVIFGEKVKFQKLSGENKKELPFNTGFSELQTIAQRGKIPFVVYLHPSFPELETKQNAPGGKEIIYFCDNNNIPLLQGINTSMKKHHFRDHIHLSESGQRFLP